MSIKSILLRSLMSQNKLIKVTSIAARSYSYEKQEYSQKSSYIGRITAAALFSSVLIGSAITDNIGKKRKDQKSSHQVDSNRATVEAGDKKPGLPIYTAEEVSKHNSKESFWVTYKNGVYDMTSFLPSHPGGEQIMNAAGLSIEPFWNVYGMHNTDEIYKLLENYRIGNLHEDDIVDHSGEELWAREPARDPRLIVKTPRPFNAETPPALLVQHFDTPNELFYVRQHMPVPELDAESHKVRVLIKGDSTTVRQFSLEDLKKFPTVTFRASLMCAGNRRSEMNKVKPVKGISWSSGAISTALWSGVLLRDVLLHCGLADTDWEHMHGKHVIFEGADIDATGEKFSTSIPLHMAMNPHCRVLLATHMNGAPLPPDHGHPLRVLVPGAPAIRSVKWLESIIVSEDESPSHWHQKDYRGFNPSKTWETADFASAPPVYSLPVTSAICEPQDGDTVKPVNGFITVKGYAYSGGGARILRVDVSADGGRSWREACATAADRAPPALHHAWTLWHAALPVPRGSREMEIWVKATDSNFNTQPESFEHIWNIRGILGNAYHKIKVKIEQ